MNSMNTMNKTNFFFSSDNLELLYNVLKQDIETKFNYNLDHQENEFKTNLLNIMNYVYNDYKDDDIRIINTKVIESSAPVFINRLKKETSMVHNGKIIRDSEIIDRSNDLKKQTDINIRPQPSIDYNNGNNLDNELTQMNLTRDEFTQKPTLVQDDFRLVDDNEISTEEMENELHKRQQQLNSNSNSFVSNNNQPYIMDNQHISMEVKPIDNSTTSNLDFYSNDNQLPEIHRLSDNASFIDKRNNETMEIINENKLVDPNEIYKKNMEDNSKVKQYLNDKANKKETSLDLLIPKTDTKYTKINNLVSISSVDRYWEKEENENRYQYSVFFSPATNQWDKVPIYENNKTIPQNQQQYDSGILGDENTLGWETADGTKYVKYQPQKPPGNIVGYDTILIKGNNNTKIDNVFKNIYSIELVIANLPIDNMIVANDDSININIYSFPYLLLNIKEIGGLYSSTNNEITNCFCKLIVDTNIKANSNQRGYEVFTPSANEIKIYSPKPLDILSKLSIRLLTPEGKLLSYAKDVYTINKLEIKDIPNVNTSFANNNYYIALELTQYFNLKFLQKTDLIIFKNIKIKHNDFNTNMEMRNIRDKFIQYLEDKTGHYIIETNERNIYNLSNTIYINNNGKINPTLGSFELEEYNNSSLYSSFVTLLTNSTISGKLINISLQNTFTFKITTNELDYNYTI